MLIKNKHINIVVFIFIFCLVGYGLKGQDAGAASVLRTVVIDAGHGGKDPGALGQNKKIREKDITLAIALKLGDLIKEKYPKIKVIYTRKTDVYVPLSDRANVANKNKADLFISIHINANTSIQPRGTETFVMGASKNKENFEVCKMENSVIVIEDDYQHRYEGFDPNSPESYIIFSLLQNTHKEQSLKFADFVQKEFSKGPIKINRGVKQGGLLVLWKTTMPAVLTEIGFISNQKDCSILITKEGQNQFANSLFRAFVSYKNEFEWNVKSVEDFNANEKDIDEEEVEITKKQESTSTQKQIATQKSTQNQIPTSTSKPIPTLKQDDINTNKHEIKKISEEYYTIQIMSVNKILPPNGTDLKGWKKYHYIKVDGLYKYCTGRYNSWGEAYKDLNYVRSVFKGAFIVYVKDGLIIRKKIK